MIPRIPISIDGFDNKTPPNLRANNTRPSYERLPQRGHTSASAPGLPSSEIMTSSSGFEKSRMMNLLARQACMLIETWELEGDQNGRLSMHTSQDGLALF